MGPPASKIVGSNIYRAAWAGVRVEFAKRDASRVPEHWRRVGARVSPVAKDRRHAIAPAHAILNYLYRLLEAETTLSLHAAGSTPRSASFIATSATGTRSASMSWNQPAPSPTRTCSTCSKHNRYGAATSTKPSVG
jgi:hypothetical protein